MERTTDDPTVQTHPQAEGSPIAAAQAAGPRNSAAQAVADQRAAPLRTASPPAKEPEIDGDAQLAARIRDLTGSRRPVLAAATISGDTTTLASVGVPLDADFEIGSITKGITGLLYADALPRGEVTPTTALREIFPLDGSAAAGVTLNALSVHRSGLPSVPTAAAPLRRALTLWRYGVNPHGDTVEDLLDQARLVTLEKPTPRYSNFGYELFGHALAWAARSTYRLMVRDRVARPLGLNRLYIPRTPTDLRPGAVIGRSRYGQVRQPWTGDALGPAGGIRSAVGDLAILARALLERTAPGWAAMNPLARFSGQATGIGAGWFISRRDGETVTWHNGRTGGFRAWFGLNRAQRTAAIVLTARTASVDRAGFRLLGEVSP